MKRGKIKSEDQMYMWIMEAYRWAERTRKRIDKSNDRKRWKRAISYNPGKLTKNDIMTRVRAVLDGEDPRLLP